ncbi:MAG: head maturation protease, ClpP-related [Pseudomonadota bacterium]
MNNLTAMRVMASGRPGPLPMPADRSIAALSKPETLQRWSDEAAGLHALDIGDNVITMFDVIGEDYWTGGGITAQKVSSQLRAIGDRPVEVHLNSPGGDMFEGIAIYNVLREHPQEVHVKIMGIAASAASVLAMAGDRVEIGAASFIMIHNCWVMAVGNRHDMQEVVSYLEPFDQAMAELYAQRTGLELSQVRDWMDAETYMSGSTAVERGFADDILSADRITKNDETAAEAQSVNEVRAMELTLVRSGCTRSEARDHINKIKGTPGAASNATPGAGPTVKPELAASLLEKLKI